MGKQHAYSTLVCILCICGSAACLFFWCALDTYFWPWPGYLQTKLHVQCILYAGALHAFVCILDLAAVKLHLVCIVWAFAFMHFVGCDAPCIFACTLCACLALAWLPSNRILRQVHFMCISCTVHACCVPFIFMLFALGLDGIQSMQHAFVCTCCLHFWP